MLLLPSLILKFIAIQKDFLTEHKNSKFLYNMFLKKTTVVMMYLTH